MFRINAQPIDSQALERSLADRRAGALATFAGWVRDNNEGRKVSTLEYECYEALANKEAARIISEALLAFAVIDITCEHRVGLLTPGEVAVWVGVSAAHRDAAFAACRFVIDQIKLRLPIWKRETYENGTSGWVNCTHHEEARLAVQARPSENPRRE